MVKILLGLVRALRGGGGNWMLHLDINIKTEMPWKFA